ncbi:MAG: hypothetical protein HYV26_22110 [Candidatus Hydrogenedentes bacterium]|nr:hypothetical protein [Candidatus Hydrogenedentota bacterium]
MTIGCLCVAAALFSGCRPPASEELLRQAKKLGDERRWDEARVLIVDYLLDHPNDVAGHFLLGQSYVHVPQDYEVVGRGELLVAYTLYQKSGQLGVLAEDMPPERFTVLYHQDTALTYLRATRRALQANFPPALLADHLEEALRHAEAGLELDAQASFLREMKEMLTGLLQEVRKHAPAPEKPPYTPAPLPRHHEGAPGALAGEYYAHDARS